MNRSHHGNDIIRRMDVKSTKIFVCPKDLTAGHSLIKKNKVMKKNWK